MASSDKKVKTVHFFLPEETYFRLIELKGRLRADNWTDFMEKVMMLAKQKLEEVKK